MRTKLEKVAMHDRMKYPQLATVTESNREKLN